MRGLKVRSRMTKKLEIISRHFRSIRQTKVSVRSKLRQRSRILSNSLLITRSIRLNYKKISTEMPH